jgi:hypothetical protein
MDAIYRLSVDTHHWPAASLFFEPANEPNHEWYQKFVDAGIANLAPKIDNKQAWIDMDNYFAALYERAKRPDLNPNLQILAPSMSQELFGEHYTLGTCDNTGMVVFEGNGRTGLDFMKKVYGYDIGLDTYSPPKADGFAWHNYWEEGQETWEPVPGIAPSLDVICPGNRDYRPLSDHLYQYYSVGMQASIGDSPTFITEADLQSPCQNDENRITSKEQLPDGSNFAYRTRDSMLNFISQEFGASYVITWLLVNEYEAPVISCEDDNGNDEINWHEAYLESGEERLWFTLWWKEAQ